MMGMGLRQVLFMMVLPLMTSSTLAFHIDTPPGKGRLQKSSSPSRILEQLFTLDDTSNDERPVYISDSATTQRRNSDNDNFKSKIAMNTDQDMIQSTDDNDYMLRNYADPVTDQQIANTYTNLIERYRVWKAGQGMLRNEEFTSLPNRNQPIRDARRRPMLTILLSLPPSTTRKFQDHRMRKPANDVRMPSRNEDGSLNQQEMYRLYDDNMLGNNADYIYSTGNDDSSKVLSRDFENIINHIPSAERSTIRDLALGRGKRGPWGQHAPRTYAMSASLLDKLGQTKRMGYKQNG